MRSSAAISLVAFALCSCGDDGGGPAAEMGSSGPSTTDATLGTSGNPSTSSASTSSATESAGSDTTVATTDTTDTTDTTSRESSGTDTSTTAAESSSTTEATTGDQYDCIDLGNAVPQSVQGDTTNAGDNVPVVGLACSIFEWDGSDVVYTWTAPAAGWYRFVAEPDGADTLALSLLDGCQGEALQCETGNTEDYGAWAAIELAADQAVGIAVDALFDSAEGPFELTVEALPECSAAIDLGSELVTALPGDAAGAGDEVWIGCSFLDIESHDDVTYAWTAPETGVYTATISGTDLAAGIAVYRDKCNNPEDQAACRVTSGSDTTAIATFPAQAGESLSIVVDTFINSDTTEYLLDIAYVGPLEGDCCAQHDTPGCSDFAVTACACEVAPECCSPEFGWLEFCAGVAGDICGACEPVEAGDCCDPHDSLSCSEPFVATCACQGHFACCDDPVWGDPWDAWCIQIADAYCNIECE